jgi:hypothetical protein
MLSFNSLMDITMKLINNFIKGIAFTTIMLCATSCHHLLDEDPENTNYTDNTDYTNTDNMISPLLGAYAEFQDRGWEDFPLIAVRGDDVNAGGLGDQQDYAETDRYNYNKDYWMYNSLWQNLYRDILISTSAIEQITQFREFAANPAVADQYIAEAKTLRAFLLLNLTRVWGTVLIPETSDPTELLVTEPSTKDEVLLAEWLGRGLASGERGEEQRGQRRGSGAHHIPKKAAPRRGRQAVGDVRAARSGTCVPRAGRLPCPGSLTPTTSASRRGAT